MSAPPEAKGEPITDYRQLVEYLEAGCKPQADWRIGTEHEKFGYTLDDLRPLPYDGPSAASARMLEGLATASAGSRSRRTASRSGSSAASANVSLEPGGQFELSGAPLATIHETCDEVHEHLDEVKDGRRRRLGVGFSASGFQPEWRARGHAGDAQGPLRDHARLHAEGGPARPRHDAPHLHRAGQPRLRVRGRHGAEVPGRLALQPVATALFANSPFIEGKPNGFLSYRSHIWTDTDPDRTGMLPFVFEAGHGLRALCRLRARRADVLRLPRRQVHRRERPVLPRLPGRPAAGAAGRAADADRLGRPPDHPLPRGAAEELPRDARRRRRARGEASARCRRSGSGCSTTTRRSTPPGTW